MKPLVPASHAQFGVGAEGRRNSYACGNPGGLQWHGDPDPVSAETCCCAEAYSPSGTRLLYEAGCEPALRYGISLENAVCRVACLAWAARDSGARHADPWPGIWRDIRSKACLQKRIRVRGHCRGNHLGCLFQSRQGIAVRTKWQSGCLPGNRRTGAFKGNHSTGDGEQLPGKSYPT